MMKSYLGLWLLLAVTFALFTVLSVVDNVKIGNFEFRTANIHKRLTNVEKLPMEEELEVETELCHEPVSVSETVLDTTSQRIMIVGDSMLEGLIPRLAAYAKHNNHKLYSVIWYASSSKYWATCDTLERYIKKYKPTYIFMALGANELFIRNIKELRRDYVKTIVKKFGDIPYVWIGPPNAKKDTGINELLQENVPADRFFLSRGMKFSYTKDGIHPTKASASQWMDSVVRWMPTHCLNQIVLETPEISKAQSDALVMISPPKD